MFREILRFTTVLFIIWSVIHSSFFYRSLNGNSHSLFWPVNRYSTISSSYDYTELGVYVIIPAIILLIIHQYIRKKDQMGEWDFRSFNSLLSCAPIHNWLLCKLLASFWKIALSGIS